MRALAGFSSSRERLPAQQNRCAVNFVTTGQARPVGACGACRRREDGRLTHLNARKLRHLVGTKAVRPAVLEVPRKPPSRTEDAAHLARTAPRHASVNVSPAASCVRLCPERGANAAASTRGNAAARLTAGDSLTSLTTLGSAHPSQASCGGVQTQHQHGAHACSRAWNMGSVAGAGDTAWKARGEVRGGRSRRWALSGGLTRAPREGTIRHSRWHARAPARL